MYPYLLAASAKAETWILVKLHLCIVFNSGQVVYPVHYLGAVALACHACKQSSKCQTGTTTGRSLGSGKLWDGFSQITSRSSNAACSAARLFLGSIASGPFNPPRAVLPLSTPYFCSLLSPVK